MIKMMLKQYSEDKSLFRKNMDMALILIVVGLVAIYFLNSFRVNMIASYSQQYEQSVANKTWLEEFDVSANKKLLNNMLKPAAYENVELVQQAQLDLIRKNRLTILNVNKGADPAPGTGGKKKKIQYAETSVTLTGAWNDIVACLNEFEKNHLVVINNLHLGTNPRSGQIELQIKFRVFYV